MSESVKITFMEDLIKSAQNKTMQLQHKNRKSSGI